MKKSFLYCSAFFMCMLLLGITACSDDKIESPDIYIDHPLFGQILSATKSYVSITSYASPQGKETHRTSSNFSTEDLENTGKLYWFCSDSTVSFDVWEDVTGKDKVFASGLTNGSSTDYASSTTFYIANPTNAKGNFVVTCMPYAELTDGVNLYVAVNSGYNSPTFRIDQCARYEVLIPSKEPITFTLMQGDQVIKKELTDGDILDCSSEDMHITNIVNSSNSAPTSVTIQFSPLYDDLAASWMSKLPNDTPLYSLTIPGTHDTGTFDSDIDGSYRCQNFNIMTQLTSGIRFFDIRLQDKLHLCHGGDVFGDDFDLTITDVISECNRFLEMQPNEVILMCIKDEHGNDVGKNFKELMDGTPSLSERLVTDATLPKLGDVRGKIVLMRRFPNPSKSSYGINLREGWPDDCTDHFTNEDDVKFYIEDHYFKGQVFEQHDTGTKMEDIKNAFKDATGSSYNDYLFIVYSSISFRGAHTPYNYAWGESGIDPVINASLDTLIRNNYSSDTLTYRLGVVVMDYYNNHGYDDPYRLSWQLINTNFKGKYIEIK